MNNAYIKNLLSINKKAFQFLHDVEGFDFEKPYFITQQPGKFTANTVKKAVAETMNPAACKISVFIVPTASRCLQDLYFAVLKLNNFSACRRDGVSYWNYRVAAPGLDIDYCFNIRDFEELRKKQTESIFIIAQDKCYIKEPETKIFNVSRRYTLGDARKSTDGRGNDYIKSLVLTATDGSGARFTYEPYNTFYGNEKRSADIADHIDKSGYLLRPHRFALMERAETLRHTRNKAEADQADFTKETAELQDLIEEARRTLSAAILSCNNPEYAETIVNKTRAFSYSLSRFATFKEDLTTKKYTSIDRIKAAIDGIKEKLNYCTEGSK